MAVATKTNTGVTKALAPFQVKAVDEEERTFTGLASTWQEDLGGDVIHRGAFAKTLQEWKAGKKVLPLIDQHNYGSVRMVVGKMLEARETADGLEADFEVIDGPDGDEIMRRLKGGYVDGLSIGYRAVKWEIEETGDNYYDRIRHLKEVQLYEVSVVIWPMNEGARIDSDSVKAALLALTPEQKAEFRALLESESDPEPKKDEAAAQEPETLEDDAQSALRQKLLGLRIHRAVTRKGEPTLGGR